MELGWWCRQLARLNITRLFLSSRRRRVCRSSSSHPESISILSATHYLFKKRLKKKFVRNEELFNWMKKCLVVVLVFLLRPSSPRTELNWTQDDKRWKDKREYVSYQLLSPLSFRISFDVLRVLFAFFASKKKFWFSNIQGIFSIMLQQLTEAKDDWTLNTF